MNELLCCIKRADIRALFIDETNNTLIQFLRYIFVGGMAFIADAGMLWLISLAAHYLIAAAAGFVFGLVVNFALSKLFIFKSSDINAAAEFAAYAVIGIIGLGITELMMYLLTSKAGIYYMLSKIITAAVVLIWNFAARKIVLYRNGDR